jgi:hypothetical protein
MGSGTAGALSSPSARASPALLVRAMFGRSGRGCCCRGRPLFSLLEYRRGFGCTVCGVPKMACLNARTAKTGAGVSGAST